MRGAVRGGERFQLPEGAMTPRDRMGFDELFVTPGPPATAEAVAGQEEFVDPEQSTEGFGSEEARLYADFQTRIQAAIQGNPDLQARFAAAMDALVSLGVDRGPMALNIMRQVFLPDAPSASVIIDALGGLAGALALRRGFNQPGGQPLVEGQPTPAPLADLHQPLLDSNLVTTGADGLQYMDPSLRAIIEDPSLDNETKKERILQLLKADKFRSDVIAANPANAAEFMGIPAERFSNYLGIFEDDADLLMQASGALASFGAILLEATNAELVTLRGIWATEIDKEASGAASKASIDDAIRAETARLVSTIEARKYAEEHAEAAIETVRGAQERLEDEDLEGGIQQQISDNELRNLATADKAFDESFLTDEDFDRFAQTVDDLVRQSFGENLSQATIGLAASGFGRSSFAAQIQQQSTDRALQANFAAQQEIRDGIQRSNNETHARYSALKIAIGNDKLAAKALVIQMITDLDVVIAGIEAGSLFLPTDITDFAVMMGTLREDVDAAQELEAAQNPTVFDLGDILVRGLIDVLLPWVSTGRIYG